MKNFLLKATNVVINIILIISCIYSVFNIVMSFLPADIQIQVYGWLHMSQEYIATFSISSAVNAAVIVASKVIQAQTRLALTTKLERAERTITQNANMNEVVVERTNAAINNINMLIKAFDALLTMQKVNAERNINASEKLVYKSEKEAYQAALDAMSKAQDEIRELANISTVYEKTEIKEVVVEKETSTDKMSGRV